MADNYDVIIIGAGISGLVCGCYLAKAGLKTLIVEKNPKPGGYCASFSRNGYHFDACVHALSSFRKSGRLKYIMNDLGLNEEIKLNKYTPSDIVVTPEFKIRIFHNIDETVIEFQKYFPKQKIQLGKFLRFVVNSPIELLMSNRSKTFKELLDSYFDDSYLKTILSVMILGLVGSPPEQVSALVACLIYKEFIFDGGYYPIGGIQTFPDTLSKRFTDLSGEILFSKTAKKIKVNNDKVIGIVLSDGKYISGKYIVSACDARETFFELIGVRHIKDNLIKKINSSIPSLSVFLVYLGMEDNFKESLNLEANTWVINNISMAEIYSNILNCKNEHYAITSPSAKGAFSNKNLKKSICLSTNVPYINNEYWKNRDSINELANRLIKMADKIINGFSSHISLKVIATPQTLYNWTYNYEGSAYGWASTPQQFGDPLLSQKTEIENLFMTGHWSNQSSGITSVANCAFNTADLILRKENLRI